ncbi:sugar ABC transporter substrate-binding protein [Solirubrobacter sp. CPCC 204708]|uniref:Sugar ABC transporter substrate-binding protein n=1 Tax=Solirubrobacter deserti TaxID=2282478 RepID=A0ABT4RNZ4_9ACTN|nr:sugar ABC transporter substrate-binding protein [Solirubrobacter deserti]MBE2317537.1 sugar ABC transporter substrate-binding protein [Solirubrobacter deserti]MDA0140287.1 sugar ABC transporter substrate-binding protein [Solirubrobacter deserti]
MGSTLRGVVLMLSLGLGLMACGEDEGPPAAQQADQALPAITFQVTGDPEETRVYKELAAQYRTDTGNTVNVVEVPERDVHLAKLTTSFSAGKQPEVFLLNYRYLGGFAARGVIDAAGPRLERSDELEREDFYDIPMQAFEYEGTLQCIPQNASSLVVYYNVDWFEAAGIEPPKDQWSYEEFAKVAERLTGDGKHGVGLDLSTIRVGPWIWSAGGELVDDPVKPTKFLFDTPEGRRGLENVIALQRNGWSPSADEADAQSVEDRFMEGKVAMFLSSRRDVPVMRQITDFEWDVAPFPVDQEPASVLHSDGFCLSKHDNADAAWKWVEYALNAKGQEVLAASGRSVPSIKAVAESPLFLAPTDPPASSKVFIDALSQMHQLPVTKNWSEVEGLTDDALNEMFYGRLSIDEGIERIAQETDGKF